MGNLISGEIHGFLAITGWPWLLHVKILIIIFGGKHLKGKGLRATKINWTTAINSTDFNII